MSTFMDHTGKSVSFVDYYKYMTPLFLPAVVSCDCHVCRRAYDKTIMDKEQPLLLHRPKRRDKLNKDVSTHLSLSLLLLTSLSLSLSPLAGSRRGDMSGS